MPTARLHPIEVTPPLPAGVQPGALVRYRGRVPGEQHSTFYIAAIDGGLLTLIDRDYPSVNTLPRVHPRVVTPTGVVVALCGCGHEAGWSGRSTNHGWCEVRPCDCQQHTDLRED